MATLKETVFNKACHHQCAIIQSSADKRAEQGTYHMNKHPRIIFLIGLHQHCQSISPFHTSHIAPLVL